MSRYQNADVEILRPAAPGDDGFDVTKQPQVLVRLANGRPAVVPKGDVTDADPAWSYKHPEAVAAEPVVDPAPEPDPEVEAEPASPTSRKKGGRS